MCVGIQSIRWGVMGSRVQVKDVSRAFGPCVPVHGATGSAYDGKPRISSTGEGEQMTRFCVGARTTSSSGFKLAPLKWPKTRSQHAGGRTVDWLTLCRTAWRLALVVSTREPDMGVGPNWEASRVTN